MDHNDEQKFESIDKQQPSSVLSDTIHSQIKDIDTQIDGCNSTIAKLGTDIVTEENVIETCDKQISDKRDTSDRDAAIGAFALAAAWLVPFILWPLMPKAGCLYVLTLIIGLVCLVGYIGIPFLLVVGLISIIVLLVKDKTLKSVIAQSTEERKQHTSTMQSIVRQRDTVIDQKNSLTSERSQKISKLWYAVISENTIERYEWYRNEYGRSSEAVSCIYGLIEEENTVERYCWFIDKYGHSAEAVSHIYRLIEEKNTLDCYRWFIHKFTEAPERNKAFEKVYELSTAGGILESYVQYYDAYPDSPMRSHALEEIFGIVKQDNRIDMYCWFLKNYSDTPFATAAWQLMIAEEFRITKEQNTIDVYNRFIMTFPYAEQVESANRLALDLKKQEYGTGNKAEDSRALLIKLKQISRQRRQLTETDKQAGYLFIEERMGEFLQKEFPREEATLRYLESEEFKDYTTTLANAVNSGMRQIQTELDKVNQNIAYVNRNIIEGNQIAALGVAVSRNTQLFLQEQAAVTDMYHHEMMQIQREMIQSQAGTMQSISSLEHSAKRSYEQLMQVQRENTRISQNNAAISQKHLDLDREQWRVNNE